jgi:hypothetical protein
VPEFDRFMDGPEKIEWKDKFLSMYLDKVHKTLMANEVDKKKEEHDDIVNNLDKVI